MKTTPAYNTYKVLDDLGKKKHFKNHDCCVFWHILAVALMLLHWHSSVSGFVIIRLFSQHQTLERTCS